MEWVMAFMPVGLLILGFPIFIILLVTSAVILLFFMQVPQIGRASCRERE